MTQITNEEIANHKIQVAANTLFHPAVHRPEVVLQVSTNVYTGWNTIMHYLASLSHTTVAGAVEAQDRKLLRHALQRQVAVQEIEKWKTKYKNLALQSDVMIKTVQELFLIKAHLKAEPRVIPESHAYRQESLEYLYNVKIKQVKDFLTAEAAKIARYSTGVVTEISVYTPNASLETLLEQCIIYKCLSHKVLADYPDFSS